MNIFNLWYIRRELEAFHLSKEGYKVISKTSTKDVEPIVKDVDLMLVDRGLPRIEGSEFVSYLRDKGVSTPVMFVSAKDRDIDIEEGYISGGDDYLQSYS